MYQTQFLVFLGHLVLSLEALDPLATISREDMKIFYSGVEEDCVTPEVNSSSDYLPTFKLDSPFSLSSTLGIYSTLRTEIGEDRSRGPVVNWKDLANLTNGIIGIFEWFRTPKCERVVRFPTMFSNGADRLDEEVLELISGFVDSHQELMVLPDTSLPSVINVLSPRASAETLRILMSHNDRILLNGQFESLNSLRGLESRVGALETLKHLLSSRKTSPAEEVLWRAQQWSINLAEKLDTRVKILEGSDCSSFSSSQKASFSATPLLDCGNMTHSLGLGAVGAFFEGDLPDAVLTCFILSVVNIAILLVISAVINRRNYQIISRVKALELEVKGRSGDRNAPLWRGKENFDQHGSSSSLSDSDIFVSLMPSSPPFEDRQHETNRWVGVELHPLPWRGKEKCDLHGPTSSPSESDRFVTVMPSSPSFEGHQHEANRCVGVEFPTLSRCEKENCDLHGSFLSLSDPDVSGTLIPSSPPFECHQQEATRCAETELFPLSAGIVRSSVGLSPGAPVSRLDKRSPRVSRHSTGLEGSAPQGVNQVGRLHTVPEENSL